MARARRACACGAFLRRHRASSCCRSSTVIVMVTVGRPVRMPKRLKICPEAQEYYVMYLSNRTLERLPKVVSVQQPTGAPQSLRRVGVITFAPQGLRRSSARSRISRRLLIGNYFWQAVYLSGRTGSARRLSSTEELVLSSLQARF